MINLKPYFRQGATLPDFVSKSRPSEVPSDRDGSSNTRLTPQPSGTESLGTRPQKGLSAHVDFLTVLGVIPTSDLACLLDFLTDCNHSVDTSKPWHLGSFKHYESRVYGCNNIVGGFTANEDTGECSVALMLPGQFWETMTVYQQRNYCRGVKRWGLRCSRIDLAIDDYSKTELPVSEMIQADEDGNGFGYRVSKFIKSGTHDDKKITQYFGSRESGCLTRVYEHEFGDGTSCNRLEVEFKRAYSQQVFDLFAGKDTEISASNCLGDNARDVHAIKEKEDLEAQKFISGIVAGVIDFRDRASSGAVNKKKLSAEQCDRLPFWQEFLDKLGEQIVLSVAGVDRTVEKAIRWVDRQVAPTLAALAKGMGQQKFQAYILDVLRTGSERKNPFKDVITESVKQFPDLVRSKFRKNIPASRLFHTTHPPSATTASAVGASLA
jgi:hypothetical protein